MATAAASLRVGTRFHTFEDFIKCLREYEKEVKQVFSKKSSKTLQACKLKGPYNEELRYYELHYICKRGGTFRSKGQGIRQCRSTKTNCGSEIKLRAQNKMYLTVIRFETKHNHPPVDSYEMEPERIEEVVAKDEMCSFPGAPDYNGYENAEPVEKNVPLSELSLPGVNSYEESISEERYRIRGNAYSNEKIVSYEPLRQPVQQAPDNLLRKQLELLVQQMQQIQNYQQQQDQRLKHQEKLMQQQRKKIRLQELQVQQQGQKLHQQEQQLHQQEQILHQLRQNLQPCVVTT